MKRALDVIQDVFGGQVRGDLSDVDEAELIRRGWTLSPDVPATDRPTAPATF